MKVVVDGRKVMLCDDCGSCQGSHSDKNDEYDDPEPTPRN